MTPAMFRALTEIAGGEEIVCEGVACWIGLRQISRATVNSLLRLVALKDVSDNKGIERYVVNGAGLALLARPEIEAEIEQALAARKPFTILGNRIEFLESQP